MIGKILIIDSLELKLFKTIEVKEYMRQQLNILGLVMLIICFCSCSQPAPGSDTEIHYLDELQQGQIKVINIDKAGKSFEFSYIGPRGEREDFTLAKEHLLGDLKLKESMRVGKSYAVERTLLYKQKGTTTPRYESSIWHLKALE